MADITPEMVWKEIERRSYAVLAFVTPKGHPRTAGIVYHVDRRKLYIGTEKESWKARYIAANPHVAMTIGIPKRIPFFPWVQIPDATISFPGSARVMAPDDMPSGLYKELMDKNAADAEAYKARLAILELTPEDHFTTYGVGVSLMGMRDHDRARGRCPVG